MGGVLTANPLPPNHPPQLHIQPKKRPPAQLQLPAPHHFPIATPPIRSNDEKNDEFPSPPARHNVALPVESRFRRQGLVVVRHNQQLKCVNHFTKFLAS